MSHETDERNEISTYVVLTVNNVVLFPGTTKALLFRSAPSLSALRTLVAGQRVFLTTVRNGESKRIVIGDLYEVGVIGEITKVTQLGNGSVQVVFRGDERGSLLAIDRLEPYLTGRIKTLHSWDTSDVELSQLVQALRTEFADYIAQNKAANASFTVNEDDFNLPPGQLADMIAPLLKASIDEKQEVLSCLDTRERLELVYTLLYKEIRQKHFEDGLKNRVEERVGRRQKEYFLNEQMRAIREEMGEESSALDELTKKIAEASFPQAVREVAEKELKRLKQMGDNTHEAAPIRTYLDWLLSMPWFDVTEDNLSIKNTRAILDEDHYGLEKIKERIVEYIAVLNAVGKIRGSILCFSGPPGVGKTSLAKSIARALGRNFARISLGGVRDEAEIRGHRRTYVGSMPGRIIQTMKKVKSSNPLILLDEVDKISTYFGGGPTSALLEVLDPEQNHAFMDHYLEVEYDLSNVLFICTVNDLSAVPLPLRDRMEILELSGYTELEKLQIAKTYLIPKQLRETGQTAEQVLFTDKHIMAILRGYTREAGVRSLDRVIGKVCRKALTDRLEHNRQKPVLINTKRRLRYLGPEVVSHNEVEKKSEVGMVTGLAWTSVGGETLSIEATVMRGSGKVQLTGKLGDIMKESAQAAISYVRAHANSLGIFSKAFRDSDIHIHVPAGGTPKDGPSAGIALAIAIVSAFTQIPIHWDVALTGEVTLRGRVLPIGGLKEKLLAARRAMMKRVIIPIENKKDIDEIPLEIRRDLEIVPVRHLSEVFPLLLERLPTEVIDQESEALPIPLAADSRDDSPMDHLYN